MEIRCRQHKVLEKVQVLGYVTEVEVVKDGRAMYADVRPDQFLLLCRPTATRQVLRCRRQRLRRECHDDDDDDDVEGGLRERVTANSGFQQGEVPDAFLRRGRQRRR